MPDEPGVGLEHVRVMPLEESTPVPRGAGASPGALHDSGPTQRASPGIRGAQSLRAEERAYGEVFWCFAGSLDFSLEDLSGEGASPLLGSNLGNLSFPSRNRLEMGFNWATEGIQSARQPRERALPRPMRARRRGSGLPMATKTADQTLGQSPIARRSTRRRPPEARTMATIPARTASGSQYQTAANSATSVGIASASMRLPSRSAWLAVAPATPPAKRAGGQTALLFASPSKSP